jgi:DNA repair ATPase RecN
MSVLIPISIGELFDKYSILVIKSEKIKDSKKLENINKELNLLKSIKKKYNNNDLLNQLKLINEKLWDIENEKRQKEKDKIFDNEFIELARNVYIWNDKRSEIKNQINLFFNSNISDVKEYTQYNY